MERVGKMSDKNSELTREVMRQCPINNTLNIIGKKFTVLILRNMLYANQTRFGQFLDSIEGINHKTLAKRLNEMGKEGVIKKKIVDHSPVRTEYYLTERGKGLLPILEQMAAYSMKYCATDIFTDKKSRTYKEAFGKSPSPFG